MQYLGHTYTSHCYYMESHLIINDTIFQQPIAFCFLIWALVTRAHGLCITSPSCVLAVCTRLSYECYPSMESLFEIIKRILAYVPSEGGALPLASSLPSVLLAAARDLSNLHIHPDSWLLLRTPQRPALAHRTASASLARQPTVLSGRSSLCLDSSPSFCLSLTLTVLPWRSVGWFSAGKSLVMLQDSIQLRSALESLSDFLGQPRVLPHLPPHHTTGRSVGAWMPAFPPFILSSWQGARGRWTLGTCEGWVNG